MSLFGRLFVYESNISERLDGFAPYSRGRRVQSLTRTSLNVKVKGKGHQGQKRSVHSYHPPAVTEWNTLAANNTSCRRKTGQFRHYQGVISVTCMQFMFGKTSLALICVCLFCSAKRHICYSRSVHLSRKF